MTNDHTPRPGALQGRTIKFPIRRGNLYVTLNWRDRRPYEVFIRIGKSGSELQAYNEALGRVISVHLQTGGALRDMVTQLDGIAAESAFAIGDTEFHSTPDAIGKALMRLFLSGPVDDE